MHVIWQLLTVLAYRNGPEEQYCADVPNPRKVKAVQPNLDSVQAALKEREKRCVIFSHQVCVTIHKR